MPFVDYTIMNIKNLGLPKSVAYERAIEFLEIQKNFGLAEGR
jgi:hypothetical protein